jgi:hypothetical protein
VRIAGSLWLDPIMSSIQFGERKHLRDHVVAGRFRTVERDRRLYGREERFDGQNPTTLPPPVDRGLPHPRTGSNAFDRHAIEADLFHQGECRLQDRLP